MQAARLAGLKARHEQRLENATYTAAEVKVLTEAALRLGRKEAGEEIVAALMRENDLLRSLPKDDPAVNQQARSAVIFRSSAFRDAAKIARDISSQPSPDATSGRTDPSGQCPDCGLVDDHKGGCPQTGEAPKPGAPG